MKNILDQLQKIDIINFIDRETLSKHLNKGGIIVRSYPKDQIVHHRSDPCETMDIILNGKLTINRYDIDGNVVHITQFKKGDSLGGNLIFGTNYIYPFDISAIEETTLLHITKSSIISFIESDRYFMLSFMKDLSDKANILTHTIHTLSERTLRQKITQFLEKEMKLQKSDTIQLKVSKKLLAERFGVARTSLSRELKAMQDEGVIDFDAKSITVKQSSL